MIFSLCCSHRSTLWSCVSNNFGHWESLNSQDPHMWRSFACIHLLFLRRVGTLSLRVASKSNAASSPQVSSSPVNIIQGIYGLDGDFTCNSVRLPRSGGILPLK